MNDDSFIRAGLQHYAEAYGAVEAFREQMGTRMGQILTKRVGGRSEHAHSRERGTLWVFANTEPLFVFGDVRLSLQAGVAWHISDTEGPLLYVGYVIGGNPQLISVPVGHDFLCVKYKKGHFLCSSPTDSDLDSQFKSLFDELDRVLPNVRRG
jgi:hypothetical protein